MATNIVPFQFGSSSVRVILIDNEPWFVGKDICDVLEINNSREALSRLKEYEKGVSRTDTLGGKQDMTIISESGLYRLVLTSRKPQAEPFQDWVVQQVLPSIRRTGSYSVKAHKIPQTYAEALLEAGRLALENEKLNAKIKQDAHLVAYAEAVRYSEDSIEFNAFAKLIGTGRTRLFRIMRECGVIMKNSTLPFQNWCDAGYFEVSQEILSDGKLIPFALVTGKGQLWLHDRIKKHEAQEKSFLQAIASTAK